MQDFEMHLFDKVDQLLTRFNTHPRDSLKKAESLKERVFSEKNPLYQAHLYFILGSCEQLLLNFEQADSYLKMAIKLYRIIKNLPGEISCLKNLGSNYYKTGNYAESFSHLQQALSKAGEDNDSKRAIYVNLGVISFDLDRVMEALEYYNLAFNTLPPEEKEQRSIILNNLGECYYRLGEIDKALFHFEEAIKLFKEIKNLHNLAYTLTESAPLLMKKNNWDRAEEFLHQAMELNQQIGSPAVGIKNLQSLGFLEMERKNWEHAFEFTEEALNLAQEFHDTKYQGVCLLQMKEISKTRGENEAALEYLEQYLEISQYLNKVELQNAMDMVSSRIQIDQLIQEKERVDNINNELEKLNEEMMLINRLAREITGTLDIQTIAGYLNRLFKELFNPSVVGIGIFNPFMSCIHFDYFYQNDKVIPPFVYSMDKENSLAVCCIKEKKPLRFNRKTEILEYLTYNKDFNEEESVVFIPLEVENSIIGVLTIQSLNAYTFTDELFQLLLSLSSFISIAVSNALSHKQIQQMNVQLIDDKDALENAYGEIEFLACHDPLTGLANRNLMEDFFERCRTTSEKKQQSMALLFIDLDGFKNVNDTFGHEAGDRILLTVSGILQKTIRKSDMVSRFGGDEFVILLKDIKSENSLRLLTEKLRDSIENPIILGNKEIKVGASLGIALFPTEGRDLEELIRVADKKMFQDKKNRKEKNPKKNLQQNAL